MWFNRFFFNLQGSQNRTLILPRWISPWWKLQPNGPADRHPMRIIRPDCPATPHSHRPPISAPFWRNIPPKKPPLRAATTSAKCSSNSTSKWTVYGCNWPPPWKLAPKITSSPAFHAEKPDQVRSGLFNVFLKRHTDITWNDRRQSINQANHPCATEVCQIIKSIHQASTRILYVLEPAIEPHRSRRPAVGSTTGTHAKAIACTISCIAKYATPLSGSVVSTRPVGFPSNAAGNDADGCSWKRAPRPAIPPSATLCTNYSTIIWTWKICPLCRAIPPPGPASTSRPTCSRWLASWRRTIRICVTRGIPPWNGRPWLRNAARARRWRNWSGNMRGRTGSTNASRWELSQHETEGALRLKNPIDPSPSPPLPSPPEKYCIKFRYLSKCQNRIDQRDVQKKNSHGRRWWFEKNDPQEKVFCKKKFLQNHYYSCGICMW